MSLLQNASCAATQRVYDTLRHAYSQHSSSQHSDAMAKLLIFATAASALQLPNVLKRGKAAPALEKMRFLNNEEARTVAQDFGTPTYVYDAATLKARAEEALALSVAAS